MTKSPRKKYPIQGQVVEVEMDVQVYQISRQHSENLKPNFDRVNKRQLPQVNYMLGVLN